MAKKKRAAQKKRVKNKVVKKKVVKKKVTKKKATEKRGMLLVHRSAISAAVKITASETSRYQINGVRVTSKKDGAYRLEATDGRRLIRIDGNADDVGDFPAVVGAGEFKDVTVPTAALGAAVKATPKRSHMPVLENVAVMSAAGGAVRLVATDLTTTSDSQTQQVDGSWPPTDQVFPKGEPESVVGVNAKFLEELLAAVRHAALGDARAIIKLEVFGPKKPIRITAHNERHDVTALLMPCHLG